MKRVFHSIAFVTATLLLLVIVSSLAFYHLLRAGEVRRFLIDEIEQRTELKTQLGAAELEIGWITGVVFRNLELTEPDAVRPAITAERITARLAILPLLRRQVVFYEIRAERPTVRLTSDRDGRFPLLEKLLNLPFLTQRESDFNLDLRSLKIESGDISLSDQRRDKGIGQWRLVDAVLDLERLRGAGLRVFLQDAPKNQPDTRHIAALAFDLKGALLRDGARMDLKTQGRFAFPREAFRLDEARWAADLDLVNIPSALVKDVLGPGLPIRSTSGYLTQRVRVQGSFATSLRLQGVLEFRRLSIDAPGLLATPLTDADGRTSFDVEWNERRLKATRVEVRAQDFRFALQGEVAGLDRDDPYLRLTLGGLSAPAAALFRYVPFEASGSGEIKKVIESVQSGRVEIKKATVDAPLSRLRRLGHTGAKDLRLEAELHELTAKPAAVAAPLRGVHGKIHLADGVLTFKQFRGAYGDSRFTDVTGRFHLTPEEFGRFEMRAVGDVNLAELEEQSSPRLTAPEVRRLSLVQDLTGRGKVEVDLRRAAANARVDVNGKVMLRDVALRASDVPLSGLEGDIVFSPTEIKSETIRAQLDGSPVQIQLALNDYDREDGSFALAVESSGVKAGVVSRWLLGTGDVSDPGIVRGSVRYAGSLNDKDGRRFTGDLDLIDVQLAVAPLLQPLRELNGQVLIDENGIDFVNLRALLAGIPAAAAGRWRYSGTPRLFFDFTAPNLDITYLLSQIDPESSDFYADLVAEGKITLGKGRIKKFDFTDLYTNVTIDRRVWRLTGLRARSAGGTIDGVTTIFDRPETLAIHAEPRVQNVPMQSFLNWFDLTTTEMSGAVSLGGRLETAGVDDAERKQNLNGAFHLRIEDGTIRRMRILVQILNLLDLSRWFTLQLPDLAKEGIRFRSIAGDFKVTQGVYATENLVVDSSDLRMTGAGKIDVPRDEIDFVVAVRPFADIDSAITRIPILGRGIAAIKNSFLVASFNIRGRIDDPTITPAPLGTISEMFWSILGIPKNAVGLDGGEPKGEPAPAPGK